LLRDKVAIVSGANRTVGFEIAKEFTARNARIFVCSSSMTSAHTSLSIISNEAYAERLVVTDVHGMSQFSLYMAERHNYIDILINNAGYPFERMKGKKRFHEVAQEDFERVIEVDDKGAFRLSQAPIQAMTKNNDSSGRTMRERISDN
jgi:3-oxoacyl-[acyl-carrier protein] reductase